MSKLDSIGTHKTRIIAGPDGRVDVQYHATIVASKDTNGRITLNSGGWKTVTTKRRMNQALRQWGTGYYVHQVKGEWLVGVCKGNGVHERVCEYYDGITLQ